MTRCAVALALFALAVDSVRADDPPTVTPKPVAVYPAAAPKPALKYLLLPDLTEMHEGNKAHLFMKAFAEQSHFFFNKDVQDERQKYLEAPLEELPAGLKDYGGNLMKRLHDAACAEQCDWQMLRELKRDGVNTLLPDVQYMRHLAAVLKVRCRGEIKAGDFPAAIRTVQTMLALARSFNDHPTLIGQLVGCAIAAIGLGCVEEMTQQPGCPNLYWALSDLPAPLIDIDKGLKGDRVMCQVELADFRRGGAAWTDEESAKAFRRLHQLAARLDPLPAAVKGPADLVPYMQTLVTNVEFLKASDGWLRDAGYAAADVKAMPDTQRVIVGSAERLDALRDDLAKWMRRPYWEMPDEMKRLVVGDEWKVAAKDVNKSGMFGGLRVTAMKVKVAQTRTDSLVAQLRMVEALRMTADAHGKFPAHLPADLPVPVDPFSGKPFVYALEDDGKTAVFTLTPPLGLEVKPYSFRYRVSVAKK
jgi:hypothetical protein